MSRLRLTLIDVGHGDSIFLESEDEQNNKFYGLVDSNDSTYSRSSYIFLKRFIERQRNTLPASTFFDWVLLTHAHTDHSQGLKRVLQDFGTKQFWYPQSAMTGIHYTALIRHAKRSKNVKSVDVVDTRRQLPNFGAVQMSVLWPQRGNVSINENNNSVVIALTLHNITFVLTGDTEADGVWVTLASSLPKTTQLFKVPHHGAANGMFDNRQQTPWLNALPTDAVVAISCHVAPYQHPDPTVISALTSRNVKTYRTDQHFHLTFETTGQTVDVGYSHV